MNTMAPIRTAELRLRRVRLTREPVAAGAARRAVRAAIRDWQVPVDADLAVLLTSDLVTSAITHGAGATLTLAIRLAFDHLRVDVYDASRARPAPEIPPDWENGPALALVATLADAWGSFRTPAGKAVFFTVGFTTSLPPGDCGPRGLTRGDGGP